MSLMSGSSKELAVEGAGEAQMYMGCVRFCQVERRGGFRRMRYVRSFYI
jgi:hypothetical protein